jgi:hypothetical protein
MWQRISAHEFVPSRLRTRRWEPKGKVVRDDDLGAVHVIEHVTGNEFAAGSVAVGPLGWRTRNRSLIVKPGAQIRKPRVKYLLPWRRSALIVCQAMSMAMTVVLPAPVASFSASRISSGLASLLADARWSSRHLPFLDWGGPQ